MGFEDYNRSPDKRVFQKTLITEEVLEDSYDEVDFIKNNPRFGAAHVKTPDFNHVNSRNKRDDL